MPAQARRQEEKGLTPWRSRRADRITRCTVRATRARSDRDGGSGRRRAPPRNGDRSGPESRAGRRTTGTRALARRAGTRDARARAEQVARELAESRTARLRFRYFIPRPGCNSSRGATASAFASRSTLTRADVPLRAREVRRAHGGPERRRGALAGVSKPSPFTDRTAASPGSSRRSTAGGPCPRTSPPRHARPRARSSTSHCQSSDRW